VYLNLIFSFALILFAFVKITEKKYAYLILVVIAIIQGFFYSVMFVPTESMEPTIERKTPIILKQLPFNAANKVVNKGDIVAATMGGFWPVIKRVVAIEGDVVEWDLDHLTINGLPIDLHLIQCPIKNPIDDFFGSFLGGTYSGSVKVPPNSYFIVGDNYCHSEDSRVYGAIHIENILSIYVKQF